MRLPSRATARRPDDVLPGLLGTARSDRRIRSLLPRLRPGDVAVVDHADLDRGTAEALVSAGVAAVVNAAPMSSGRHPNLGPTVLLDAGVLMVDGVGAEGFAAIPDGAGVRVHGGRVLSSEQAADRPDRGPGTSGGRVLARGRAVDAGLVAEDLAVARLGLATQLEALTHNTSEFLRREQDLLISGRGLPRLRTVTAARPVVVVGPGPESAEELATLGPYLREQRPVLVAVGAAADRARKAGWPPDVVVVDGRAEGQELPAAATLTAARDVVVRLERGGDRAVLEQLERTGVTPHRLETAAIPEDAALLLAAAGDPLVVVAVGLHAGLDELLDRQRDGLASTHLTRLVLGQRLVDASVVPSLYSGRVRPRHLLLVMLAGLLALAAAVSVTPVGGQWADLWGEALAAVFADLSDLVRGSLS